VSGLTTDQILLLTEILAVLAGIGITWAVYYGSERAELPGTVGIPDPTEVDDAGPDTRGRTLR